MRKCIRNLGWLICVAPILGLVSEASPADAKPAVHHETGFHHTGWNGLGAVFDLKQSSEGYLWLTTSKGVLRFDGVRFQSVEEVTHGAVQDAEIDSVFISPSSGLWFTTQGAGLLFWKDGQLTTFPDRRCTPIRKKGKIIEDRDSSLWVQARAGLFRLHGSVCEQIGPEQGYPGGFPADILLDSDGTLWVKPSNGPLLFLPRGQSKFQVSKVAGGLSTGYAYLHEAPDGAIWLSDNQGLRRVTRKLSDSASSPPNRYKSNEQLGDFTVAADGAATSFPRTGQTISVRRDHNGTIWSAGAGHFHLWRSSGKEFLPLHYADENLDSVIFAATDRNNTPWITTNSGRAYKLSD